MTDEPMTNGRPRWTDVLRQQELSEQRMVTLLEANRATLSTEISEVKRDVAEVKTDVANLKNDISDVRNDVQKVITKEEIRDTRAEDLRSILGGTRNWVALAVAVAAVAISLLSHS